MLITQSLESIEEQIKSDKNKYFKSLHKMFLQATHLPAIGEDDARKRKKKE